MMATLRYSTIALLAVVLAMAQRYYMYTRAKNQMNLVLDGLKSLEESVPAKSRPPRVAVGLGGCMDVFTEAVPFLKALNITPTDGKEPSASLDSLESLSQSFSYFFKEGAAAERYFSNKQEFQTVMNYLSRNNDSRWVLGGNAPVMGNRLAKEGCQVLLGARSSKRMRSFFHENMQGLKDNIEQEDVHVILEYKVGDTWGPHESKRANRFIFHSDQENPYLGGVETFEEELKRSSPDLLVIGGLQLMDKFPYKEGEIEGRLQKLKKILSVVPSTTRIHFEMASFTETHLFKAVLDTVLPYCDSIGMNEQELPNLESLLTTGSVTLAVSAYPRTALMLDQVRRVFALLDQRAGPTDRRLSRVHLHTLGYQVVAVRSGGAFSWPHPRAAAAKASLTANRHTCGLHNIDIERSKMLVDDSFAISAATRNSPRVHFNATEPVSCWHEGALEMCVSPVLVCTRVRQTAGGGDNISAATLAIQL